MIRRLVYAAALLATFSCADDDARDGDSSAGGADVGDGGAGLAGNAPMSGAGDGGVPLLGSGGEWAAAGAPRGSAGQPPTDGGTAGASDAGGAAGSASSHAGAGHESGAGGEGAAGSSGTAGDGGAPPRAAGGVGAAGEGGAGGAGGEGEIEPPSLPCNIAAILKARCTTCHSDPPVNFAPMSLTTYDDVGSYALAMQSAIEYGEMPPQSAIPLDDADASTLTAYLALGAPPSGRGPCP